VKTVFADTFYWVAIANPRDQWHESARRVSQSLEQTRLVTTDEVLVEFLTLLSSYGAEMRNMAVRLTRSILSNPNVQVVPQTRSSFLSGLALYEGRPDKEYSLTDCISMQTMRDHGLAEVLTHDHNFEQEGFTIMLDGGQNE